MSFHNIIIRQATMNDAELLTAIGEQTFSDTYAADNTAENLTAYLEGAFTPDKQRAELADDSSCFLIAEVADEAVGYAKLRVGNPPIGADSLKTIELERIYSVKDWIGYGVGSRLMQACLDEAQKRDFDVIWLGVWERNSRAQSFYKKWGFEAVGTHIFQLGDDPQTDFVMRRKIYP
jgi:ribosomal protein S18 acetylase RimI-like enzyme